MSRLLNTGLDRETLSILVTLCESGVNPEALAVVVKELRKESAGFQVRPRVIESCSRARELTFPFPPRLVLFGLPASANDHLAECACSIKGRKCWCRWSIMIRPYVYK